MVQKQFSIYYYYVIMYLFDVQLQVIICIMFVFIKLNSRFNLLNSFFVNFSKCLKQADLVCKIIRQR